MTITDMELSLSGIAHLTKVKRPVVSMWRRRAAQSDLPFPDALATVEGEERFDAESIVDWLEACGRGNNTYVRADAAAYALPVGISLRNPRVFDGLTALLCLKLISGVDLGDRSSAELHELASEADPGDHLLAGELNGLGEALGTMASYADRLADSAYGPMQAFDELLTQRFRHQLTFAVQSAVTGPVHDLTVALSLSLARDCGAEPPRYVDPTAAGSDLLMSVMEADADQHPDLLTREDDSPTARLFRRRLRVHDVHVDPFPTSLSKLGPAVAVVHLPAMGRPEMCNAEMLDAMDEIALSMDDQQRAVVVAPARLLSDRLRDRALDQRRSQILRIGRVRAMVRLPAGLVVHRSRQALALWVLGPDLGGHPLDERRIAAIDVSDEPLTKILVGQIRDDVVAAMADPRLVRAHSYAVARMLLTSTVLAQKGALIPPDPRARRSPEDPAAAAVLIARLRQTRREQGDALADVVVEVRRSPLAGSIALGEAVRQRHLRVLPGNRDGFDLVEDGNVQVIGVPELVGHEPIGRRRIDRLSFLGGHPAARLTEAGDVVFSTSPTPAAVVDQAGGSAVPAPARILRVDGARGEGLSPYVIAADINDQPSGSRAWRAWSLRRVAAHQVPPLADAVIALEREQAATSARLAELDELHRTVVQGVADGSLALTAPTQDNRKQDS